MPRFNVEDPETGKWRCFSTVSDSWITEWMPEKIYEEWRRWEYGRNCGPVREANIMSLDEAIERMSMR